MSTIGVVHTTKFKYDKPVIASYNEIRMLPVNDARQQVRRASLEIDPSTSVDEYIDYWGTSVTAFEALNPHDSLMIRADSVVDVFPNKHPDVSADWEKLGSDKILDNYAAFLSPTPTTQVPDEVAALAREAAGDLRPFDACVAALEQLRDQLSYVPGVTNVHTPATAAWEVREGVCQDMAHLGIGALQTLGVPARYVSGYLYPLVDSAVGETVRGESHAWLEFWVGSWVPYDPTNRCFAGSNHVVVARGREYGDVPPLKGVFAGAAASELQVTVEVTRLN